MSLQGDFLGEIRSQQLDDRSRKLTKSRSDLDDKDLAAKTAPSSRISLDITCSAIGSGRSASVAAYLMRGREIRRFTQRRTISDGSITHSAILGAKKEFVLCLSAESS